MKNEEQNVVNAVRRRFECQKKMSSGSTTKYEPNTQIWIFDRQIFKRVCARKKMKIAQVLFCYELNVNKHRKFDDKSNKILTRNKFAR